MMTGQTVYVSGSTPTIPTEMRDGLPVNRIAGHERITSRMGGITSRYKFLPWLDDTGGETREHLAAYMEMYRRDDAVRAAINQKVWGVSSLDWQSHPATDSPRDKMISEFLLYCYSKCRTSSDGLIGPVGIVEELLIPLLVQKYVVAEKILSDELFGFDAGKWRGYRGIKAIKTRQLATLEEDGFGNVTGIIGPGEGGGQTWNDPKNFIVIKNLSVFGVPSSDLRPVYRWFVAKDTLMKLWLIGLEKFGTPYMAAKYPIGADDIREELESQLEKVTGRTYVVVPDGVTIDVTTAFSTAANFEAALDRCDRGIMVAINHAFLQSQTSGTTGDRGNSLVQQATAELPIWRLAKVIESVLESQVSPDLIHENFANACVPKITLGAVNEAELEKSARLDSALLQNGMDLSMKEAFKRYGRMKAADESDSLIKAKRDAQSPPQQGGGGLGALGGLMGGMGGGGIGEGGGEGPGAGAGEEANSQDDASGSDAFGDDFSEFDDVFGSGDESQQFSDVSNPKTGVSQDSELAAKLLSRSQDHGRDALYDVTASALERAIAEGGVKGSDLFDDEERGRLKDALRDIIGPAELLGRSRILARAKQAEKHYADRQQDDVHRITHTFSDIESPVVRFSSLATDLHVFNDLGAGQYIEPMPPAAAVDYFTRLVPELGVDPKRFGREMDRQAFTLAVATEETILRKVQDLIAKRLESGEGVSSAAADIDALLDEVGVSPTNPGYAEMVFRTNAMDAYNTGAQRQLSESADTFPIWQYSNPDDGRSRPHHADLNGRYFSSQVPFNVIRGTGINDVANCRCVPIPIDKWEWSDLRRAGAVAERVPAERAVRKFSGLWARYRSDLHRFDANGWIAKTTKKGGIKAEKAGHKPLYGDDARRVLGGGGSEGVQEAKRTPRAPKTRIPKQAAAPDDVVSISRRKLNKILRKTGDDGNELAFMIEREAKKEAKDTSEKLTNKTITEALTDADFFANPVYTQGQAILNATGSSYGDQKNQSSWYYLKAIGETVRDSFQDAKREFGTGPALAITTVYTGLLSLSGLPLVDKVLPKPVFAVIPIVAGAGAFLASFGLARAIKGIYNAARNFFGGGDDSDETPEPKSKATSEPKEKPGKAENYFARKKGRKPTGKAPKEKVSKDGPENYFKLKPGRKKKLFADSDFTTGRGLFAGVTPEVIIKGVRQMEEKLRPLYEERGIHFEPLKDSQILGFFNYVYGRKKPTDDADQTQRFSDWTPSRSRTGGIKAIRDGHRPLYGDDAEEVLGYRDRSGGDGGARAHAESGGARAHAEPKPRRDAVIKDRFNAHIAKINAPREQKVKYARAVAKVLEAMPPKVKAMFHREPWHANFYASQKELIDSVYETFPSAKGKILEKTLALCAYKRREGSYHLFLDGDDEFQTLPEIYAHEFSHMLDGRRGDGWTYSSTDAWKSAWGSEPTTAYSRESEREGFAEFGRILYSGRYKLESVEQRYPKCSEFFKKNGLWPGSDVGDETEVQEVFEEKIDLDADGNHADVIASEIISSRPDAASTQATPEIWGAVLGPSVPIDKAASLIGGDERMRTIIEETEKDGRPAVAITGYSDDGSVTTSMRRIVYRDAEGKLVCRNASIEAVGRGGGFATGKGSATAMFPRQVQACREAGFDRIECTARRDDENGYVGYAIWPKLGYDGEIPKLYRLRMGFSGLSIKKFSDLMATSWGPEWWKKNGGTVELSFDLNPGSRSLARLNQYLAARGKDAKFSDDPECDTFSEDAFTKGSEEIRHHGWDAFTAKYGDEYEHIER